jgi:hypothetical protein
LGYHNMQEPVFPMLRKAYCLAQHSVEVNDEPVG